ncbi:MAG: hypothetical protein CM15mP102_02500 [Flavobacteriales bacterium]|nr:MAG: hypothetical protein CM15mP102_02500 [Flavobacteriales bacterium]
MEHKWDEGFGTLYGQEADATRLDLGTSPLEMGQLKQIFQEGKRK